MIKKGKTMRIAIILTFIIYGNTMHFCFGQQSTASSFEELEALFPLKRYEGNPIIECESKDWKDSQVYDPVVLEDPNDENRLIMYASGMTAPVQLGRQSVGRFTAHKSNPFKWELSHGPVFTWSDEIGWKGGGGNGVRLGSAVYDDLSKRYLLYYTSIDQRGGSTLGVVTSTDGIHWERCENITGPLIPFIENETNLNNPCVIKDGDTWYMYFGYRTDKGTLKGVRYATSPDGIKWTRQPGNLLSVGVPGSYDSQHIEWFQVFKLGVDYVMVYECFDNISYSIAMANSEGPDLPFAKSRLNPMLSKTGIAGTFDEFHVATGSLYFINGSWILYYSGAFNDVSEYGKSRWHLGAAYLGSKPEVSPENR
jgi:predicted GH43/DUF377 family glycosyl hydrolase